MALLFKCFSCMYEWYITALADETMIFPKTCLKCGSTRVRCIPNEFIGVRV